MASFYVSRYMPCAACGASVETSRHGEHTCDPARAVAYRMFQLRGEIAGFEDALGAYLQSPHGKFALWLAERDRRRHS